MPLKSRAIEREEFLPIKVMSGLERESRFTASTEIVKSRVWDRRLYKHKAAGSKNEMLRETT